MVIFFDSAASLKLFSNPQCSLRLNPNPSYSYSILLKSTKLVSSSHGVMLLIFH